MSDAHERLRQYLEQRREQGESEFVLDALSIEDALKVLTAKAPMPMPPPAGASRGAAAPPPSRAQTPPPPPPPDSAMRRSAEEAAASGDWREALRAVDAAGNRSAGKPVETPEALDIAEKGEKPKIGGTAFPLPATAAEAEPSTNPALEVGAHSAPSSLGHLTTLDAVAAAIQACGACSLASTKIKDVPGEGSPLARFVVVGEAPGQSEDEEGRPFVGRSGELLTKILDAIGFKREDVFICNVLKHRPPGNRNPTSDEISACRPFLLRQLELLQPKVILALGTFAAQTLLETDSPIGKLRGLEHRYHGIPLVATYHPAALLRNPNWKRPAWEDVQLARRIFDRP